jgi:hypothetical protein
MNAMKHTSTGLCLAAAFGFAVSLGAQSPTSTTSTQRPSATTDNAHELTITGCLSRDASGGYMLTNARSENGASSSTTTASGATTTAGTTGTSGAPGAASTGMQATTWMLSGGTDLDKHVGHKIQVTGKASSSGSMDHGGASTTTASGAGTTASPNPTTAGTTSSGSTAGTTGTLEEQRNREHGTEMAHPRLDVQSVKMISTSCS